MPSSNEIRKLLDTLEVEVSCLQHSATRKKLHHCLNHVINYIDHLETEVEESLESVVNS